MRVEIRYVQGGQEYIMVVKEVKSDPIGSALDAFRTLRTNCDSIEVLSVKLLTA